MHNCYYYMILFVLLVKIYAQSAISFKVDQVIYLVNEQLITSCITKKSLVEYYSLGIEAIELDLDLLKEKVNNTLKDNLPKNMEIDIKYYFYNCINMEPYVENVNKCNSVQMKLTFTYMDDVVNKYLRYQLVEDHEII